MQTVNDDNAVVTLEYRVVGYRLLVKKCEGLSKIWHSKADDTTSRSSGRSIHDPGKIRDGCGSGMSTTFYGGFGVTGQFFPKTWDSLVFF